MRPNALGALVVAGGIWNDTNSTATVCYTAKYAGADGGLLWDRRQTNPAATWGYGSTIGTDRNDNVVVTGASDHHVADEETVKEIRDEFTMKYSGADGRVIWEQHHQRPVLGWGDGYGPAVALDREGNVNIAGVFYMARYAAADGTLLWDRFDDTFETFLLGPALALDRDGNVVCVASFRDPDEDGQRDLFIAKYAAAAGALIWKQRYSDQFSGLAIDGSGTVVVSGSFWEESENGFKGYSVVALGENEGAPQWRTQFTLPGGQFGEAQALALGADGAVAVAGSIGNSDSAGFVTVLYRDARPRLFIEKIATGVRLRCVGNVGVSFMMERAAAVRGPWESIATLRASAEGNADYLDATAPVGGAFYRIHSSEP